MYAMHDEERHGYTAVCHQNRDAALPSSDNAASLLARVVWYSGELYGFPFSRPVSVLSICPSSALTTTRVMVVSGQSPLRIMTR